MISYLVFCSAVLLLRASIAKTKKFNMSEKITSALGMNTKTVEL